MRPKEPAGWERSVWLAARRVRQTVREVARQVQYTHVEMSKSRRMAMPSVHHGLASLTPFSDHNQSPRSTL